jgi:glycosyltransferase involved in cell wall biosynthesis
VKILFVHQNMPGQFVHLATRLAEDPANEVVFLTKRHDVDLPGVTRLSYAPPRPAHPSTHHYVRLFENGVLHGQQVVRVCLDLQRRGFRPDLIVAHPGWGEALFVKDIFPAAPLLNYCEFYYSGTGADVGFDPADPADIDTVCRARARNAHLLLSLESCDRGISPTEWQKSRHPAPYRSKISVIFDGIDTGTVRPDPAASVALPNGRVLTAANEVVTYVARNLEPYRGFPTFIRSLPELCRRRPDAQIVVVGGDEVSYGRPPKDGGSWREAMAREVALDPARVHFLGKIPYGRYLDLLRISSAHVYLTVPFVLSWSFMEAMASECLILASSTAPVLEVIEDGRNGLLVDFFSPGALAERVADALANRAALAPLRRRARETVMERYALSKCLPAQVALVREMAAAG